MVMSMIMIITITMTITILLVIVVLVVAILCVVDVFFLILSTLLLNESNRECRESLVEQSEWMDKCDQTNYLEGATGWNERKHKT